MFERLTIRRDNEVFINSEVTGWTHSSNWSKPAKEAIDRLAAYEDSGLSPEEVQELAKAKTEGRLMIMPCKPGDIVFVRSGCLFYKDNAPYTKCEVVNLRKGKKGGIQMYLRSLAESAYGTNCHRIFPASSIGVTVFLTREEAEKALEGLK